VSCTLFFKEETHCELEADFSASYSCLSSKKEVAAVIYFTYKKKRTDYLHSESLLNVILRRLSYKVKYGCGQFNFSLEHSFQRCISKIPARERPDF